MTSESRNSTTKSAEGSPHLRVTEERKNSRPCGKSIGNAVITSRSLGHQKPSRREESKLWRESAIKRVTQNT